MRKQFILPIVVLFATLMLVGCGNGKISNDIVSISKYKKLNVEEPANKDDADVVSEFEEQVWEEVLSNATVEEFPKEELESLMKELETQYSYVAYSKDMNASELIEEIHGMTTEELAKKQLKKKYVINLIAEEEKLTFSDKEYEDELTKRAKENDFDSVEDYESMYGEGELYEILLEERVLEFLIDNL